MLPLLAFFSLPALLLQRTSKHSKAKANAAHLQRRLDLWNQSELDALLHEGTILQKDITRLPTTRKKGSDEPARRFQQLISRGQVHDALRLLSPDDSGAVRPMRIDELIGDGPNAITVEEALQAKHPPAQPSSPGALLAGELRPADTIRFEAISAETIKASALTTKGSAGPSGLNAHAWRRICTAYKGASNTICSKLATLAQLLATMPLDSDKLSPLVACRLVALRKTTTDVRPIGVCEVVRRIISKPILQVAGTDIQEACGPLQTCVGLPSGIEAATQAMQALWKHEEVEGILLVDAANAFNRVNREAALHNIPRVCPMIGTTILNIYRANSRLIVSGGGELSSKEGTTQGDPLAMAMYALALTPFVQHLHDEHDNTNQIWYADDSAAASKLRQLRRWWDDIKERGKQYGCNANSHKTQLLVKEPYLAEATALFQDTGIEIRSDGVQYLGTPIGKPEYISDFINTTISEWCDEVAVLARFAETEPHAAYSALQHGLKSKWTYVMRSIKISSEQLQPLTAAILRRLLPAITELTAIPASDEPLLALPARLGGLGTEDPAIMAALQHGASQAIAAPLREEILGQCSPTQPKTIEDIKQETFEAKRAHHLQQLATLKAKTSAVRESMSQAERRQHELHTAKGASSWLTCLPLAEHGFVLNKRDFRDSLAVRFNWPLRELPTVCECGADFTQTHAMICPRGGHPTTRHNEVRDLLADLLTVVSRSVRKEPQLLPITNEVFEAATANTSPDARSDIKARGFWTRGEDAFFDVRIVCPTASSYLNKTPATLLAEHESKKKLEYAERIVNVDHGSFTPIVFATTGGIGKEGECFLRKLASSISYKDNTTYSATMAWLRCRLSFALLRATVFCLRGARSSRHRPAMGIRELALVEAQAQHEP